jgi:hypothetical protein
MTRDDWIAAIVIVAMIVAWCLYQIGRFAVAYTGSTDVEGQPLQHGTGTVESITYLPGNRQNPTPLPIFRINIAGQTVEYRSMQNLQPNEHLSVSYRVGKSGTVYVEQIDP